MIEERIQVSLQNIEKSFRNQKVIDGISLDVRQGEFLTLLGPSGCGKTTLLRMINGFEKPDSGSVLIDGEDQVSVPPNKRNVNTVFQSYALFPHLTVRENVEFSLKMKKVPEEKIVEKVNAVLEMTNLEAFANRKPSKLSGGQQQRVAIARSLVCEPKVLLLDEPLGALDLKLRKQMQMELKDMQKASGITYIYVTHDQEEALSMSDTVVVMNEGIIQQVGSPEDIYNEPENRFVASFIGESNIIEAVMKKDLLVSFDGYDFECVDKGFKKDEDVEVVIRPEDIDIVKPKGLLQFMNISGYCSSEVTTAKAIIIY